MINNFRNIESNIESNIKAKIYDLLFQLRCLSKVKGVRISNTAIAQFLIRQGITERYYKDFSVLEAIKRYIEDGKFIFKN